MSEPHKAKPIALPKALRADVAQGLGNYVYGLVDPRNEQIFYVGKGKGSRFLSHETEAVQGAGASAKHERIREILSAGERPRIDIIRHGLPDDETAFMVEAAIIDALTPGLTNAVAGHGDGRMPLDELKVRYAAPDLETDAPPALLIRLSRWKSDRQEIEARYFRDGNGWRPGMTSRELGDSLRAWWKVSPRTEPAGLLHQVRVGVGT